MVLFTAASYVRLPKAVICFDQTCQVLSNWLKAGPRQVCYNEHAGVSLGGTFVIDGQKGGSIVVKVVTAE